MISIYRLSQNQQDESIREIPAFLTQNERHEVMKNELGENYVEFMRNKTLHLYEAQDIYNKSLNKYQKF